MQRVILTVVAHLRSLSLLLCFSLRWLTDRLDRALLQPPLSDFVTMSSAALTSLVG